MIPSAGVIDAWSRFGRTAWMACLGPSFQARPSWTLSISSHDVVRG